MSTPRLIKDIQAGRLTLTLTENGHRLDELIAFASRLNPRRGYLFVSRVLGKHIPVRPSKMDAIHAELAQAIQLRGNTAYVVGMAETAVGLGAGVARHLGKLHEHSVFHHTTRFLVLDPWLRIREAHSHADTMHMARLEGDALQAVKTTEDLVLVDDEISTGRTLAQLAHALMGQPELSRVKRLHIVSIVSWLDEAARAELLSLLPSNIEINFVQLMAGTFSFAADPEYQATLPDNVDVDFCDALSAQSAPLPLERQGLYGLLLGSYEALLEDEFLSRNLQVNKPHVVYGMGEFLDTPFRVALALERSGMDVLFQSSTRSPIALGDEVANRLEHPAPGDSNKTHFLYNAPLERVPLAFDGIGLPHLSQALETAHRLQANDKQEQVA
ncbi:phosphoribosyltransferase domain-containing protein [Halomonas sp. ISL-60]|uniref:phosphoribosyltransferase domain-containing protein n=1 Tax=Halomonas sp. ISL-56 TaxID=2819149 RepID=UPI001BE83015|nr:phosphoribosyltransferase domain-containing protein [Halomonas sp. ISL-56]MBT2774989.1 phosphoribosyltransferase domain-containing protein [Halomonas sp. ISL-60]MBT2803598.1 phosphoribosyltransferase domain-containing protein [Halomonas sp. ISL-56]